MKEAPKSARFLLEDGMGKSLTEQANELARLFHWPRGYALAQVRLADGIHRALRRKYPGDPARVRREYATALGIDPAHFAALCEAPESDRQRYVAEAATIVQLADKLTGGAPCQILN